MTPDEFRKQAHVFTDWMADYLKNIENYPVRSQVKPGEITAQLAPAAPYAGEPMERIFQDFKDIILPGMSHWQNPNFFAFFPSISSPPSVLAEMLTNTMGAICLSWQSSPAATELETRMMEWLREALDLPAGFQGVTQDSASASTLCAFLAAREKATGYAINEQGFAAGAGLTAYCSAEAHSSIDKAARIAGYGSLNLRKIPVDAHFSLQPEQLEAAILADIAAGRKPAICVATLGTTSSSGFDDIEAIGRICNRHGIWLHVDAAWAGSALILPECRWMSKGMEYADSMVFNPHKWLYVSFDCSVLFVRDPGALIQTFEVTPEYLKAREGNQVINYRDWGIPLGRAFRSLKLWFVLRTYGIEGLQAELRRHIALAEALAQVVAAEPDFDLVAPARLALFCFRFHPKGLDDESALDRINERLLNALNDSGEIYLTQTRSAGKYVIRFSVGQAATEARHTEAGWLRIKETARSLAR